MTPRKYFTELTCHQLTKIINVDDCNQFTIATHSGTLTVAGLASEPRGGDAAWG